MQAAGGQLQVARSSRPIGEVLASPTVDDRVRRQLELVERARNVLAGFPDLNVEQLMEQPDVLTLAVDTQGRAAGSASSDMMNAALAAITAAGIPVLRFELEGARLSDAFLKMTSEAVA